MKIAVYITGGIASYKAIQVVRNLQKSGHTVRVGMTKNAENFVGPQTVAALTKYPVLDDLWSRENQARVSHIELADWTDLALVVPASADVIGKMANGIADDAVTTTLLATAAPKFVVPTMNMHMLDNPAVVRNLKQLAADGIHILQPAEGMLAEGYSGRGRMPEPEEISTWVEGYLKDSQKLSDKTITITAGGTIEPIDPVRFIGNHSSGKMGFALAEAAVIRGARVKLIYGNVTAEIPTSPLITPVKVSTTEEMLQAVEKSFKTSDVLIMAAAVADYRPINQAENKIKKHDGDSLNIQLEETPDILKTVANKKRPNQLVIGFAAETQNLLANADKKLNKKHADWIIANDVSKDIFGSDMDQITLLQKGQSPDKWPKMNKVQIADKILDKISNSI